MRNGTKSRFGAGSSRQKPLENVNANEPEKRLKLAFLSSLEFHQ